MVHFQINQFFPIHDDPAAIYSALDLDNHGGVARFRSIGVEDGQIILRTRTGGGNRSEYCEFHNAMRNHPNYLNDEDDDFDSTYCYHYFSIPEDHKCKINEIIEKYKQVS